MAFKLIMMLLEHISEYDLVGDIKINGLFIYVINKIIQRVCEKKIGDLDL